MIDHVLPTSGSHTNQPVHCTNNSRRSTVPKTSGIVGIVMHVLYIQLKHRKGFFDPSRDATSLRDSMQHKENIKTMRLRSLSAMSEHQHRHWLTRQSERILRRIFSHTAAPPTTRHPQQKGWNH